MPDTSILTACICLLVALFLWFRKSKASFASLPPGPKPVPFLGNVFDLTAKELWLPASRWAKQYGGVVYVHVLGVGIVFLNTAEAACDLLDKRGSIYSDKPFLMMSGELCGCKNMVAFTPYGEQSKRQRRLLHKAFGLPVIPTYYPFLQTGTHAFLRRLVVEPSEYMKHIRRYSGGLTLSVVYGYEAVSNDDEFLGLAEECVGILSNHIASGVGIWPVDVFPSLRHLPTWMPGAGFKRNAAIWKKKMEEFVDRPYEFMKNSMKSGTHKASFCSNLLEDESIKAVDNFEFDLKWSANSMYSASIDTTITTVSHFILAMMMHTDAQRKAQEELDRVVGTERLPTFADRASLPFVECVFKESLRWAVPVPLSTVFSLSKEIDVTDLGSGTLPFTTSGLPHRLMEDDVYNGMLIPKGTLIFGNIWAMLRNEAVFPDADAFRPERFLDKVSPEMERKRDPQNYVFGFGRRECPGSHLVDSSIWLLIASMLATLDVSKAVDECGNVMEPTVKFENPIFRTPSQFKCDMRPRSQKALSLIRQSEILTT